MDKTTLTTKMIAQADTAWGNFVILYPDLLSFNKPVIKLNNRIYKTAGRCLVEYNMIELSTKLFVNNYSEMMDIILPHEMAHQIDYNLFGLPKRWHGKTWQNIMESFGLPANPYHSLEL